MSALTKLDGFIELAHNGQRIILNMIPLLKMSERDRYVVAAIQYCNYHGECGNELYKRVYEKPIPNQKWIKVGISSNDHFILTIPVCPDSDYPGTEIAMNISAYLKYIGYTELGNSILNDDWYIAHRHKLVELNRESFKSLFKDFTNERVYICPCKPTDDKFNSELVDGYHIIGEIIDQ